MTKLLSRKERMLNFYHQPTKKNTLVKYLLIMAVLVAYAGFISLQYGAEAGFTITVLTWSFFVFCTPIADAGFVLDFPIRLITKIRMVYSEFVVWVVATIINIIALTYFSEIYSKTFILTLFHYILANPFPFWVIIFISALGTFLSVYLEDELLDVAFHKDRVKHHKHILKYQIILFVFLIVFIFMLYTFLLHKLGVTIPL